MKDALKEDMFMYLKMDLNLGKPGVLFCNGKQTRELTPGHFIHFSCVLHDSETCEGIHLQNISNENNWGGNCQQDLDGCCGHGSECKTDTLQGGAEGSAPRTVLSTVLAGGV